MALMHVSFFSESLELSCSMDVIVPQPATAGQIGMAGAPTREKYPVLYLLHGLSDDHSIWQRRTSVERYASELPLIIVMPAVNRSFYSDEKVGNCYFTFVSEELPRLIAHFFPASDRREDTFAAGLSMGGYGALKLGLCCPDKFAAVAALSGAVDMALALRQNAKASPGNMIDVEAFRQFAPQFGTPEEFLGSDGDLAAVFDRNIQAGINMPKVYMACGTEDFLLDQNRAMRARMQDKVELTYIEEPGDHEWGFWDRHIQTVLSWLPIIK